MHQNMEVSAEKVARCEAKAQRIVETLIDPVTDETDFLEQLRWINQDHYQYITEEKAVQKICGYPLCEQGLVNIPKKKYQICTKNNKVYDLTERKNFCSNQCYKASCFLKQQLFVSPLWGREQEEEPKFKLLKNPTELQGDEISFHIEKVTISDIERVFDGTENENSGLIENCINQNSGKIEMRKCDKKIGVQVQQDADITHRSHCSESNKTSLSFNHASSVKREDAVRSTVVKENEADGFVKPNNEDTVDDIRSSQQSIIVSVKNTSPSFPTINESKEIPVQCDTTSDVSKENKKCPSILSARSETKPIGSSVSIKNENVVGTSSIVLRVEKSLREWFTIDTLSCLMGTETVKQQILEKCRIFETKQCSECNPCIYERYAAISKKLKVLEVEDDKHENDTKTFEKPTKPVPDYATLKEQTKEMEIKVRSFYRGDKKVTFDDNGNVGAESENSVVLPPVHHFAKVAIRRNIVLEKLKITLPDLVSMLGLRAIYISEKIKQLAFTCKFSAHNITFKPLEWNLICLVLIKLLSLQDSTIQACLHQKAHYVNAMLMSYQLENNYLDLLCTWLTDLDETLKNEDKHSCNV